MNYASVFESRRASRRIKAKCKGNREDGVLSFPFFFYFYSFFFFSLSLPLSLSPLKLSHFFFISPPPHSLSFPFPILSYHSCPRRLFSFKYPSPSTHPATLTNISTIPTYQHTNRPTNQTKPNQTRPGRTHNLSFLVDRNKRQRKEGRQSRQSKYFLADTFEPHQTNVSHRPFLPPQQLLIQYPPVGVKSG